MTDSINPSAFPQSTDPMAPFKTAARRGGQAHYVTERSVPDARDVEIERLRDRVTTLKRLLAEIRDDEGECV